MSSMTKSHAMPTLNKMIDHSLLHPTMTDADLKSGCELAARYEVATVCIKPYAATAAREWLKGSTVGVCTVVGFPHGGNRPEIKVAEAMAAIADGAVELDMVANIGKVLSRDWGYVEADIRAIVEVSHPRNVLVKVIFENDFLPDADLKAELCRLCTRAGVDFVKTSTGYGFVKQADGKFSYKGATEEDLKLMRKTCPPSVQVKAAGGVRTLDDLLHVRELGVTRIGATTTAAMLDEAAKRGLIPPVRGAAPRPAGAPTQGY